MTDKQIQIGDGRIKVVRVSDLKIGMHVCELDKPWLELPFEPPFQLQGFRIQSIEEIAKIRQYCSHVYIDTERAARKRGTTAKRPRTPFSSGVFSTLRNSLNPGALKLGKLARTLAHRSVDSSGSSSGNAGRATASDYENLYFSESDDSTLPRKYEILASNAPKRIVYQNQTTLEEEFEPAKLAIEGANSFYADLVEEVQKSSKLDYPKLRERVDTMARSIIRNPDALSYLVQMKSTNKQTYNLAISSCVMVMAFARFLGLSNNEIKDLGTGALLQDVGMVKLPPEILNKKEPLTDTEFKLVQRHVTLSRSIVERIPGISKKVVSVCYYHHERYDGSGYPRGLKQDQIPLFSMITGIVDTYMALTSFRSYRRTSTSYEALCELTELKNKQFIGALVDRFIQNIAIFPVGSFVQLNSGHVGVVVARNPMRFLEPKVMLVVDPQGNMMDQALTINFASEQRSRFFEGLRISSEVIPDEFGIDAQDFFV